MTTGRKTRDRAGRGTWKPTLAQRRWAYSVLIAAGSVAVAYGIATTEQLAAWLVLGGALLGVGGLALANPTKPTEDPSE